GTGRYRRQTSVRTTHIHRRANVGIGNAVAIGNTARLSTNIGSDPLDTPAGHRIETGIDEGDGPALVWITVKIDPVLAEVDGDVVVLGKVIDKIGLDHVALVTAANDKLIKSRGCVALHNVPDNRTFTDLNQ